MYKYLTKGVTMMSSQESEVRFPSASKLSHIPAQQPENRQQMGHKIKFNI